MLFNSVEFILFFLPLTLLIYYTFLKFEVRFSAKIWLIISSLFFYAWWSPKYLILLITYILFNYSFSILISNLRQQLKLWALIFSIAANVLILCYFKYFAFIITNISYFFGTPLELPEIILPLAISFHTFQMIAYQIDVFQKSVKDCSIYNFFLFVTFFPQLIAGPIVLHGEILSQFERKIIFRRVPKYIAIGLMLFIIGLIKKVILADNLAKFASPIFHVSDLGITLSFFEAWAGVLAYTFQLYFDFSGYADMALGGAYLFGIKLPINFNSPYQATSIIEFWRRWHITLSRFLKTYIYIPLGGAKKGNLKKYRNLLLTMLLGGIWHGAGWTFIVWGMLHGFYLIINHFWRAFCQYKYTHFFSRKAFKVFIYWPLTFFSVCIAWVFFRATSISSAMNIVKSMIGINGISLPNNSYAYLYKLKDFNFKFEGMFPNAIAEFDKGVMWISFALMITLFIPNSTNLFSFFRVSESFSQQGNNTITFKRYLTPNIYLAFFTTLALWICIVSINSYSEFLYFQF